MAMPKALVAAAAGGGVLLVERARQLLEQAQTVDEAKEIRDKVVAMTVYVRARGAAEEDVRLANIARLWAERRIGELTRALPKASKAQAGAKAKGPGKRKGAGDTVSPAPHEKQAALEEKGITKKQAQRWEKLAEMPAKAFEAYAEQRTSLATKAARRAEEKGSAHVARGSSLQDWRTPAKILEAVRDVFGSIDLDPATTHEANELVRAKQILTKADDPLNAFWFGRVFLNPPYAEGVVDGFVAKLVREYEAKNATEAILLTNNATETVWAQRVAKAAAACCFPAGRIRFLDASGEPKGSPLQGQVIFYLGPRAPAFVERFEAIGVCWMK